MKTTNLLINILIALAFYLFVRWEQAHPLSDEEAEWVQSLRDEMAYDYDYE